MSLKKQVEKLNEILRRELGSTPFSDGIYQWADSETLVWPSYFTGRSVEKTSAGGLIYLEREYRQDRMSHKLRNQWVVTKWFPAEKLDRWQEMFPGADYPARGYRVHTDWYNPPGKEPTEEDTQVLIHCIRRQMGLDALSMYREMEHEMDVRDAKIESEVGDMVRNEFTAFLNITPGKRGGAVSPQSGFGESPVLGKETVNG